MAVVDGYTFSVDMEDRGVVRTLRQMKNEASAMKSYMRAGFETIQQGEGTLSAYNFRLEQSERQIRNYNNIIKELDQSMAKIDERRKADGSFKNQDDANAYAKQARQIENYRHQINKLEENMRSTRSAMAQFNSGLMQNRQATESVKNVMQNYVNALKAEGRMFSANRTESASYREQHRALVTQYRSEVSETSRLQAQLAKMRSEYANQASIVDKVRREHGENSAEYQKESAKLSGLSEKVSQANTEFGKQATAAMKVRTSIAEVSRQAATVNDGGITRLSRAMNTLDERAKANTSHIREWGRSVRSGFAMATAAIVPVGAAMGKSIQMAASLQQSWTTTRNLLETGAKSAKDAREEVAKVGTMEKNAASYSKEYGYSQKKIADQYTELVKRGFSATQSIGSMKSMLQAARASGDDFGDVVKNVSSTVDAFNLRVTGNGKKATEEMVKNAKEVTNAMAYAADMTATDFQSMGEAMSYVSASAHQAGFSVEQTTAAVGELSNAGIEGTRAGTGLRKTINSLIAPTKGAQEALKKYGMSVDDFKNKDGSLKPLSKIMETINEHTEKLGKADRGAFFKAVFGTTGQQSAMVLAQSAKAMDDLVKREKEAEKTNYVQSLAQKNMQSTQMAMQRLKTNIDAIAIDIGNSLLPAVNQTINAFSNFVGSNEGQKTLKEIDKSFKGLAGTIADNAGNILNFFGGFVSGLADVVKFDSKVVSVFGDIGKGIKKFLPEPVSKRISGFFDDFPKKLGTALGVVGGAIVTIKALKGAVNGMSAVRQDLKNALHMSGITEEESQIKIENHELERNVQLWKEHNTVSGGGSNIGSDISINDKNDKNGKTPKGGSGAGGTATKIAEDVEKEAGPAMESAGAKSGSRFIRGFKSSMRLIADIAIQTFSFGLLDFDMVKFVGSKLLAPFKLAASAIKKISFFPDGRTAALRGAESATGYAEGLTKGATTKGAKIKEIFSHGLFDTKAWEKGGSSAGKAYVESAGKAVSKSGNKTSWFKRIFSGHAKDAATSGKQAGESFVKGTADTVGKGSIKSKKLFSPAVREATESGTKAGESFAGKVAKSAVESKGPLSAAKSLGAKMGGGITIAIGAVDLFQALTTSSKKKRAQAVGRSIGSTTGGAIGTAIGATLGSVFGPIGTAAGSLLGGTIGASAGSKIGAAMGKAWPKIKRGASKAATEIGKIFGGIGKTIGKGWDSLKKAFSGSSAKKSVSKNTGYSASDRKLVQQMTTAVKAYTKALQVMKKVDMGGYFNKMSREIRKSNINRQLSTMSKSVRTSARYWKELSAPLKQAAKAFQLTEKSIKAMSGKNNGLRTVNKDVQNLYRTIKRNPFGKLIAEQAKIANNAMGGKRAGFVNEFNSATKSMTRNLRSFRSAFNRDWKSLWEKVDDPVRKGMSSADKAESKYLNDMESDRSKFSSAFLKGWDSWLDSVKKDFKNSFSKLPDYAQSAMKDVISRLNKGISGINSTISSFGGDKHLSAIKYADGTGNGHPGGHMLVNDSVRPHWKELVLFPNGQAMIPQKRNTLIPNAPQGTQVLSGEETYKFMNSIGVHKYADGTLSDSQMEKLSEMFEKNPQSAAKQLIMKLTDWKSNTPFVADFGPASAVAFAKSIANVLKDQMAEMSNPPGTGVARWRPAVLRALSMLGLSSSLVDKVLRQIQTESGGNPHAKQPGADPDGDGSGPALGLMQTKRSTFNAYKLPGHGDLWNGFDDLLAGLNYAKHRYGPGLSALGNGHGYEYGGEVRKHGFYEIAEKGLPETIIPMDINKRPRALSLINETLDKMESDGGGTQAVAQRYENRNSNTEKLLAQAVSLLAQVVGVGKQQVDAIMANGQNDNSMRTRRNRQRFYTDYGMDQRLADYQRY